MGLQNWNLLEDLAKEVNVELDPSKPKESRLAVALAYDKQGKVPEAAQAMMGRPSNEISDLYLAAFAISQLRITNPQEFYQNLYKNKQVDQ